MRLLFLAVLFMGTPVYLTDRLVMPALDELRNFYSNVDALAQDAAGLSQ